jgi:hypothetical protein
MATYTDKDVIHHWLRLHDRLKSETYQVESWPDDDSSKKNVDALCRDAEGRTLAIEHTLIEPYPGHKEVHVGQHYGETKNAAHIATESRPTSHWNQRPHPMDTGPLGPEYALNRGKPSALRHRGRISISVRRLCYSP